MPGLQSNHFEQVQGRLHQRQSDIAGVDTVQLKDELPSKEIIMSGDVTE